MSVCLNQAPGKLSPSWLGQRLNHVGSATHFGPFSSHTQIPKRRRTRAETTRLLAPGRGLQMEKQENPGGRIPCGPAGARETHVTHSYSPGSFAVMLFCSLSRNSLFLSSSRRRLWLISPVCPVLSEQTDHHGFAHVILTVLLKQCKSL